MYLSDQLICPVPPALGVCVFSFTKREDTCFAQKQDFMHIIYLLILWGKY